MAEGPSPMMAQYLGIKADHADALLFYRMGDFYELFFEDAAAAAAALDIALTKRGQHEGRDIPMCGVPVHSHEAYLNTLIRKGFRVAICEQTEDPAEARKRGAKSVVRREVVRLVTPGTLTEDALLEARGAAPLAAWAEVRGEGGLAWLDLSTGAFAAMPAARAELAAALARTAPRELLLGEAHAADAEIEALAREAGAVAATLGPASFESGGAERRLTAQFGVATLEGFGAFSRPEIAAMGAVLDYVRMTQGAAAPHIRPPRRETAQAAMAIDPATRRNLELTRTLSGAREGALLTAVDRTVTPGGARLLETRLAAPLTDPQAVAARQDAVAFLRAEPELRARLRAALKQAPETARPLARLALDRAGPRDLGALRDGLARGAEAGALLAAADPPAALADAARRLGAPAALAAHLAARLAESPPMALRDGGTIAQGVDAELDAARKLRDEGRGVIAGLQADYAAQAGVASLKIRHNGVLGYFIEVGAAHGPKLTALPDIFRHRQTMANAMRFTTDALADLESRILGAADAALAVETRIFGELRDAVLAQAGAVADAADALAEVDVAAGFAELAEAERWVRPVVEQGAAFEVVGGRHPVVEQALKARGEGAFIPNDCDLSGGAAARVRLLTGPNMAGKSTWLRQNALIAVLAQAGACVPAEAARIGVVDRLFSRVGAADDLARGRSTFMVEMVETAAILNQAGPQSLVVLDEIGRGTATYDGLSIAWATLEHLHDVNRCRALFATHYHELTALAQRLEALAVNTMAVREWKGEVVFLHEVRPGAADRSYGVQVARLAGLPPVVVDRAREVLAALEEGAHAGGAKPMALIDDLPLFAAARPPAAAPAAASPALDALRALDPDAMTPREALDALYALKSAAGD
ncbi:DNA mismatch repair protein MutS [Rubrimonas cliftonensis]|uniref:DNA mismatch repair protein MutS n=1 Tax=Rubrimonas cliftonensis TaxID=89524 RepID=A0A1H3Z857_9RHOB|nr:DNA mismatch repair protein MutS [Rubrimonas cliftonensis]SEA19571.1 DNA mismatch repair protein MutS [Rubrimonas cliftonensis]